MTVTDQRVQEGRCGAVDWAVCATPYPGQARSGDAFVVRPTATGILVGVVDGLGHGHEAADVADAVVATIEATEGPSPTAYLVACHQALLGSRGAAMTLSIIEPDRGRLLWVAVGNVEAVVVRRSRGGAPAMRWSVPLRGGVVGSRLPPLHESTVSLAPGDVLVSATDGVAPAFLDGVDVSIPASTLARRLHGRYAKTTDDSLMLAARWDLTGNDS
jgi:hypothetical protein